MVDSMVNFTHPEKDFLVAVITLSGRDKRGDVLTVNYLALYG